MASTDINVDINPMASEDSDGNDNLMVGMYYDPLPPTRPLTPPPIPEKTSPPILPPKVSEKFEYDVAPSYGH